MNAAGEKPVRGYLSTVVGCYCPRCRQGKLFKHGLNFRLKGILAMNDRCPVCEQLTDIEVGFYYGTSFVSYTIAVLMSAVTFALWWLIIGFSFNDDRFMWWVILNAVLLVVLQPWLMRFSRSLWLSWFVRYDPLWRTTKPKKGERINESHMSNW